MKTTILTTFVTLALVAARCSSAVVVRSEVNVPGVVLPGPSLPEQSGVPLSYHARRHLADTSSMIQRRDENDVTDAQVLNFALYLELLEQAFYEHGLSRYSKEEFKKAGYPAWVRGRFEQICEHEKTHVQFLESALTAAGAEFVQPCEYIFTENSLREFIDLSEAMETVGTSAYTGGIQYITNDGYTTAAASILATEARHASWINSAVRKQNPWNTAFETPLTVNQVHNLALNFIKQGSCPTSNDGLLPSNLRAYPQLTLAPKLIPGQENQVSFSLDQNLNDGEHCYVAFLSGAATIFAPLKDVEDKYVVDIPQDLKAAGTVYVVIFKGGKNIDEAMLDDETMIAGPAIAVFPFDSRGEYPAKGSK